MQGILRIIQETIGFFTSLIKPSVKSIVDNRGLFALSVLLAFALWIFVTDAENPTRTRTLPFPIPVEATNVGDDVALAADIQDVTVRVTVADDVYDNLVSTDFLATVDLTGYGVGTHEDVPVDVRALRSDGGLRVESLIPEDGVEVQLAQLTSKSVPVDIVVEGSLPTGFSMTSPEHVETVRVTGPQVEVDKVDKATATIDVTSRTKSIDQAIRLTPRTDAGFLVQLVTLDPDIVDVKIDIEQLELTRPLAINVVTEGAVADGYNVVDVSVDPPTVIVRGDSAFIDDVFAIDTQPIDIEDADETIEISVSLDIPSGVTVAGDAPVVTVTIEIAPAEAEFHFTVPVEVRNLGDGLSIAGGVPTVQVIMEGPYPIVSELEVSDIRASINLEDLGTGTHTVNVIVANLPGVNTARAVPSTLEIVLE
jgi:YbbR domain-containing protein